MEASDNKIDFFISYTRSDLEWAKWIHQILFDEGYTVQFQEADFFAGQNFVYKMDAALKNSRHLILILSKQSIKSLFVTVEWTAIIAADPLGESTRLIPVRVDRCEVEGILKTFSFIDLTQLDEREARQELLTRVSQSFRGNGQPTISKSEKALFPGASGSESGKLGDREKNWCKRASDWLASSADQPAGKAYEAAQKLLEEIIAAPDSSLISAACRLLSETLFVGRWLECASDPELVWLTLHRLHQLTRKRADRVLIHKLESFVARIYYALGPSNIDLATIQHSQLGISPHVSSTGVDRDYKAIYQLSNADTEDEGLQAYLNRNIASVTHNPISGDVFLTNTDGWIHRLDLTDLSIVDSYNSPATGPIHIIHDPSDRLYASRERQRIIIRSVETHAPVHELLQEDNLPPGCDQLYWSTSGERIYVVYNYEVYGWSTQSFEMFAHRKIPATYLRCHAYMEDHILCYTNGVDDPEHKNTLLLLHVDTLEVQDYIALPSGCEPSQHSIIAPVPTLRKALLFIEDSLIWWDALTRCIEPRIVKMPFFLARRVSNYPLLLPVQLSADGCHAYCLTADNRLVAIDVESGNEIGKLTLPKKTTTFCLGRSEQKLLAAGDGLFLIDPAPLYGPESVPLEFQKPEEEKQPEVEEYWLSADGRYAFYNSENDFWVVKLGKSAPRALNLGLMGYFKDRVESDSSLTAVFLTREGELGVLTLDRDDEGPAQVFMTGYRFYWSRVMSICHLRAHIIIFRKGRDDQNTHVDIIAWQGGRFTQVATARVYAEDRLRAIVSVFPVGTGILIASRKRGPGGLYYWPDPITDIRTYDRQFKPMGRNLIEVRGEMPFSGDWQSFLRTSDPRRIIAWNARRQTIADVQLKKGGDVEISPIADGINFTTWSLVGHMICASIQRKAVYVIDITTSRVTLIATENEISLARISGDDTEIIEVYSILTDRPFQVFKKLT